MTLLAYLIQEGYDQKTAHGYIKSGKVLVNDNVETLINFELKTTDKIIIKAKKPWVSRGAYKLLQAITEFKLDFKNKIVLDIGASTGGFTQVALHYGAKKVYANDVGNNQLAYSLRIDPRVKVMEKRNLKTLTKDLFDEAIDLVVCDVSFISLNRVFDVLKPLLKTKTLVMALIKPQFQASSNLVENKGIVKKEHHQAIIKQVIAYAQSQDFIFKKFIASPITGKNSQNQEYLSLFQRS